MSKLEKAKEIIKAHYNDAECGIFFTWNWIGDSMETVYYEDGLHIQICYEWAYFEVFGLNEEDEIELEKYYLANGGPLLTIGKKDCGHHPHGLDDPTPIIQFILHHT